MLEWLRPSHSFLVIRVLGPSDHGPGTVTFKVRLNGIAGTDCTFSYASTRGGVVEKKVFIGKK